MRLNMLSRLFHRPRVWALLLAAVFATPVLAQTDPLPSWNDGAAKQAIIEFVKATTTQGSATFVPAPERIATFDQDGTLWVEHPMYSQVMYILERVPALVKAKPELAKVAPYSTVLAILKGEMFRKEIQQILGLKDEKHFRTAYQQPAIAAGLIEMTVPDKPHSRLQKYRITPKGIALLNEKSLVSR